MLHSTLPRAFLTPGLKYLSNYYGEDVAGYQSAPYQSTFEEHYPRITEHHHVFPTWHTVQRSASPCPLDLSLKPASRVQENDIRDDEKSPSYILDVEEEYKSENIVSKNYRNDDHRIIIPYDNHGEKEKLEIGNENLRIGVYSDDEVRLQSPTYQKMPSSLHPQSSTVQGYGNQQILMTPQHHLQTIHAPMTPPSTPSPPQCPRKRQREELRSSAISPSANNPSRQISSVEKAPRPKKKHARRLKFDEDTSSPVSGTVILGPDEAVVTGDIDPAFNVVEVTEEARAELAKIENRLGPYQCRLCRQLHEDAFQLAQHRCSRIAHVEYRCPECDKRFSCPANLASHRRWHKPRVPAGENTTPSTAIGANGQTTVSNTNEFSCSRCDAKFSRQAALRKHISNHHSEVISNCNNDNGNIINNGRNSAASNASSSSIVENVEQVLNHVGNQLGVSPLTVEMP